MALRLFARESEIWVLYGGSSFLFLGYRNVTIEAWNTAGEVQLAFNGHTESITCLLEHVGHLWSGSWERTVRVWNIDTGECTRTIHCGWGVWSLCEWQGTMVVGGTGGVYVWDIEGEKLAYWEIDEEDWCESVAVWREWLCSGNNEKIVLWNSDGTVARTLTGHTKNVTSLAIHGEHLFSGSGDETIKKWNSDGQCVATFTQHTDTVTCLLVWNRELYSSSYDGTASRCTLDGTVLQQYKVHTQAVYCVTVWRGALFSGGGDKQVIQWTAFTVWSPVTHAQFSGAERAGIKTMMMLARKHKLGRAAIPRELLYSIMQYYTAVSMDTQVIKRARS